MCDNAHHDVTTFEGDGSTYNTKKSISQKQNMAFRQIVTKGFKKLILVKIHKDKTLLPMAGWQFMHQLLWGLSAEVE